MAIAGIDRFLCVLPGGPASCLDIVAVPTALEAGFADHLIRLLPTASPAPKPVGEAYAADEHNATGVARHRARPRFMEILDKLDGEIIRTQRSRCGR